MDATEQGTVDVTLADAEAALADAVTQREANRAVLDDAAAWRAKCDRRPGQAVYPPGSRLRRDDGSRRAAKVRAAKAARHEGSGRSREGRSVRWLLRRRSGVEDA